MNGKRRNLTPPIVFFNYRYAVHPLFVHWTTVFQLAANMVTSVEMIDNFYVKKRMRDPKMATGATKFRVRTF
jgi:hypothetical protein